MTASGRSSGSGSGSTSGTEIRDLLLSVGFASVHVAGGQDGETRYDEAARRLVAVGRLPPER